MTHSLKLELRQSQKLAMTPQLRQAIGLLQMTNTEILAALQAEAEQNPLLEVIEPAIPKPTRTRDLPSKSNAPSDASAIDFVAAPNNPFDVLQSQIRMSGHNDTYRELACRLVYELDSSGIFDAPEGEICACLEITAAELAAARDILQECEPVGVGARDLRECLMLQLRDADMWSPTMEGLLDNLALIATGKYTELARKLSINQAALDTAIEHLQTLNPHPLADFNTPPAPNVVPDIIVTLMPDGNRNVELNTMTLPRVLINEEYRAVVTDKETRLYYETCLQNARFLVRAVDRRARTILQIATMVVQHQNSFFHQGITALKPLTLSEVAAHTGMHESTVSRALAGKYLTCERGVFAMRFFFARAIGSRTEGIGTSNTAIKEDIRRLVTAEDKQNPLSDKNIEIILAEAGMYIARRTIAKYRMTMGIPSSSHRRR